MSKYIYIVYYGEEYVEFHPNDPYDEISEFKNKKILGVFDTELQAEKFRRKAKNILKNTCVWEKYASFVNVHSIELNHELEPIETYELILFDRGYHI